MKIKSYNPMSFRRGFGNYEKDDEVYGFNGSLLNMGDKFTDGLIPIPWKTDRLENRYPGISPYSRNFMNPIAFDDPDGKDGRLSIDYSGGVITLETTIHLYGKNSKGAASVLNKNFEKLAPGPRKFKDENGKVWSVQIKITYSDANVDAINKMTQGMNNPAKGDVAQVANINTAELKNFTEGDNIVEIDYSKNWTLFGSAGGYSGTSGAVIGSGSSDKTKVHEPFHLLGFSDWYKTRGNYITDVAKISYTDVMHPLYYEIDEFQISNLHYVDLIKFAKIVSPTTTTNPIILNVKSNSFFIDQTIRGNNLPSKEESENADKSLIKGTNKSEK